MQWSSVAVLDPPGGSYISFIFTVGDGMALAMVIFYIIIAMLPA
ncbi:unnamed protein product [Amoebophrya sp. A25]|nr:unnamed protein product [Amoebophrya sp. A25]|eukprot:GSA25T00011407001.1